MRRTIPAGTLFIALTLPAAAAAQVGLVPHIGTLGVGMDIGIGLGGPLGLRGGANITPWEFNLTESGIDYVISLPSPQYTVMLDLSTPVGFRFSGGILISPDDIIGDAEITGSIEFDGVTYTSAQVSALEMAIVTKTVSPYVGIGWGSPGRSRFGVFVDVGVALQGSPMVVPTVTGALASDPTLLANLDMEAADLESEISEFKYYPVLTVGFSIGLGTPLP